MTREAMDSFTRSGYDVSVTKKYVRCHPGRLVHRFPFIDFNSTHNDGIQFMRQVHKDGRWNRCRDCISEFGAGVGFRTGRAHRSMYHPQWAPSRWTIYFNVITPLYYAGTTTLMTFHSHIITTLAFPGLTSGTTGGGSCPVHISPPVLCSRWTL